MDKDKVKWLYGELPQLVNEGVLSSKDSESIHTYYGDIDDSGKRKLMMTIFGILGAILIGGGIILLLAKNWQELSRPVRTCLSFIPVILGQALCGWAIWHRAYSTPWREGAASFLFISLGASISLIGQTYNIPGDTASFALTWMLLGFPLVYLMNVTVPGIFYISGITVWAIIMQQESGQAVLFWALFLILMPYVYSKYKDNAISNHFVFLCWTVCIALCIAIGVTLEKGLPGLWIIVYSAYFVVLYLAGSLWFSAGGYFWQNPLQVVGGAGVLAVSYLLTYKWPWIGIGWQNYRNGLGYSEWARYFDYFVAAVFVAAALYLICLSLRRKNLYNMFFGGSIILAIITYIEASVLSSWIALTLYNFYLLSLGIGTVVKGIRSRQLGITNGGMMIIALLAVLRFFDSTMGFVERGIIFILVGSGFLVSNLLILRNRKGDIE